MPRVYQRLGFSPFASIVIVLFLAITSLLLSDTNIPLTLIKIKNYTQNKDVEVLLTLNVGGAVIPLIVSIHILIVLQLRYSLTLIISAISVAMVSLIVYRVSRVVDNVGITVPLIIPPLTAASATLILTELFHYPLVLAGPLSYVAGTIGTLIGADVYKLREIVLQVSRKHIVSIGGFGTFDSVYLSGMLSVATTILLLLITT
ncbi:MAG TPA: DUF1614 domain-containing protein [Desulfurococcaceae archaeon]|nr:DUF1614 domain-containing protein [Desulfurococcaceae archaeon]